MPPTAAPPAKKPILTILKQGRAFGVGMVLATQNPVDLDYKAMSNAGTWLVGRLQTERDKARVLEGLRSAAGDTDVAALDEAIGGLEKRQFLLVSAHEPKPVVFSHALGDVVPARAADEGADRDADGRAQPAAASRRRRAGGSPPTVERRRERRRARGRRRRPGRATLDPAAPWLAEVGGVADGRQLRAFLAARVERPVRRHGGRHRRDGGVGGAVRPARRRRSSSTARRAVDYDDRDFRAEPPADGVVRRCPPLRSARRSSSARRERTIERRLVDEARSTIFRNPALKLYSRPGETEERFAARADEAAQAAADAETAKIRDRLEAKRDRLETALETARRRAEELEVRAEARARRPSWSPAPAASSASCSAAAAQRAVDRPRRQRDRHGRLAPRDDCPGRASAARTAEEKVEETEDDARGARAGDPRRGGRDRREMGRDRPRDRDRRDPARGGGRARRRARARVGPDGLSGRSCAVAAARRLAVPRRTQRSAAGRRRAAASTRVSDGDTILLTNGREVRLVQIDAPELGDGVLRRRGDAGARARSLRAGSEDRARAGPALDDRDGTAGCCDTSMSAARNVNWNSSSEAQRRRTSSAARGRYAEELERAAAASRPAARAVGCMPGGPARPTASRRDGTTLNLVLNQH